MSQETAGIQDPFASVRADSVESVRSLRARAYTDAKFRETLERRVREQAQSFPQIRSDAARREAALTLGVGQWIVLDSRAAVETLREAPPGPATAYARGHAALEAGLAAEAEQSFASAQSAGPEEAAWLALGRVDAMIAQGHLDEARADLQRLRGAHDARAEYHVLWGALHERSGDVARAAEAYERAAGIDPNQPRALFALGILHDRNGDDEQAIAAYERCRKLRPTYANALMNLGVLYEDLGDYDKAIDCYRTVLRSRPADDRARLYLKDAVASTDMIFNEEMRKQDEARRQVLESPIQEFELSVRSRKCLERMQIRTVRDLVQRTEDELLAYKNFGETSLNEIRELLTGRGLNLGMRIAEKRRTWDDILRGEDLPPKENKILATPIAELGLSVRSRRALSRLRVFTVGELIQKTEDDLLACKNFGRTSLREILGRLTPMGLALATVSTAPPDEN